VLGEMSRDDERIPRALQGLDLDRFGHSLADAWQNIVVITNFQPRSLATNIYGWMRLGKHPQTL